MEKIVVVQNFSLHPKLRGIEPTHPHTDASWLGWPRLIGRYDEAASRSKRCLGLTSLECEDFRGIIAPCVARSHPKMIKNRAHHL